MDGTVLKIMSILYLKCCRTRAEEKSSRICVWAPCERRALFPFLFLFSFSSLAAVGKKHEGGQKGEKKVNIIVLYLAN